MIYPSIDKLLVLVNSKYELVHIAGRRSREIKATDHYQKPLNKYVSSKNIGKALEEVADGLIEVKRTEEN